MRKLYFLAGMVTLAIACVVGWVNYGTAQPVYEPPVNPQAAPKPILERIPVDVPEDPATRGPTGSGKPMGRLLNSRSPVNSANEVKQPNVVAPVRGASDSKVQPPQIISIPDSPLKKTEMITDTERPSKSARSHVPENSNTKYASTLASQPSVSMEWQSPPAVKVGMPADYTLTIRNSGPIPVQKVIVQVRIPTGVKVAITEPKIEGAENVLVWDLGNLGPQEDRRLTLKLMSAQRGDMACQAWVTFTSSSIMKMHVREPKLSVKAMVPEKVLMGDAANMVMTIGNPGDYPAEHVKLLVKLSEGLENVHGSTLDYDLGTLSAGETRTITLPYIAKNAGPQVCDVNAEAEGGLRAGDKVAIKVVQPRLDLSVAGPKIRYLDKKATYTMKVTNPGDSTVANVFVMEVIPAGFKFVSADNGGHHDEASRSVKWFIGELGAGQAKEVKVELLAVAQGEFVHKMQVNASRVMKTEQEMKTAVEGLSAIQMEVVDTEDPIELGSETSYEIRVANTGSKAETDVQLKCMIPPQLKLKGVQAPLKYEVTGNEVVFQTLPRLAPRADIVYRITVTAVAKGDARFKASLTTSGLVDPFVKIEPTKVYGD